MKENRRCKAHRIQPIQHAAVPFDHMPPILHAPVALDRRHHDAAGEPEQVDQQRNQERLPWVERGGPPQCRADQGREQNPADKPFHRLRR